MRIAIVSDIHGNRTAFDAVLADLNHMAPDLILHGGDLAQSGSSPAYVVDRIGDLGWPGVVGNADEMLFDPPTLRGFLGAIPGLEGLLAAIEEMAAGTREALGQDRIAWLSRLPRVQKLPPLALVHASPESTWSAPTDAASDGEMETAFGKLGEPIAVYGHIHRPFVRRLNRLTIINTGSVSLSYDGDPRASYLLLDDRGPSIRRVEYDVENEIRAIEQAGIPHGDWIKRMLLESAPSMP
jgi:predicted phosphodiesterase